MPRKDTQDTKTRQDDPATDLPIRDTPTRPDRKTHR